jgi:hypothetical protein
MDRLETQVFYPRATIPAAFGECIRAGLERGWTMKGLIHTPDIEPGSAEGC